MDKQALLYNMALATMTKEAFSSELFQHGLSAAAEALHRSPELFQQGLSAARESLGHIPPGLLQRGLPAAAGALGLGLMGPRTGGKLDRGALLKNMLVGGGLGLGLSGADAASVLKRVLPLVAMSSRSPSPGDPNFMGPVAPSPSPGDPNFMGPVAPSPSPGDPNFMGPVLPVDQWLSKLDKAWSSMGPAAWPKYLPQSQ